MTMMLRALLPLLLLWTAALQAAPAFPTLSGRVVDEAALILVLDLAPARLDLLIQGGDVVHAAPGQSQQQGESQQALGGPVPE